MSRIRGYLIVAAVIAVGSLLLNGLLQTDPRQRNLEIFTEMVYSKAVESFTASASLPGGTAQQPLVAGVVPRGLLPLPFGPGPEEAKRAGAELENPFSEDALSQNDRALARGARLYAIYCVNCHDAGGHGRGPIVQRGMLPPPSLHAARALEIADGEMFHILTFGQGNMASHAAQLSREERWQVLLYVRRLQAEGQE
ncbi:MAG: cytochrome c [Planctomycetota bacterium]